jgi:D-lactate dehydrogenase (cytochrome)
MDSPDKYKLELLKTILEESLDKAFITDAIIPQSLTQSNKFWKIREHIPLSQVEDGKNIKHDISLPISLIPDFLEKAKKIILDKFPNSRIIDFGHLGDGNIHYNVAAPLNDDADQFMVNKENINNLIHELVHSLDGSISAEHGIGAYKAHELVKFKSPIELHLMRQIKNSLDPNYIFNPRKILV